MILGIDIGGTYLRYELQTADGTTMTKATLQSSEVELSAFIENMLLREQQISMVLIAYAGQIENGSIIAAPHITIEKKDIKEYIESKYSVELCIENDLNCAVLAQRKVYQSDNIAVVAVGTGLGLGVVSDGILLKGARGIATELGHIPFRKTPFVCSCGKTNCIELCASGSALKHWQAYKCVDNALLLADLRESSSAEMQEIYTLFIEALLQAVGVVITLYNPQMLVLDGGVIQNNPWLLEALRDKLQKYAMPLSMQDLKLACSKLQNASLQGAFLLKDNNVR